MAVLECRSQAQALDWSLVLISQGIESTISCREEDGAWTLEVTEADLPSAQQSIATYERENATAWRREIKGTGLLFDARAALWFVGLALFHFAVLESPALREAGVSSRSAILHGEWWRLFTAMTLHADIAHLAANVTSGILLLGFAMSCFGAGHALLLSFIGGAIGNVVTIAVHDDRFANWGASGMVMASLGLLAAHSLMFSRHEKRRIWIGRGVLAACLLVVLLGLSPKSDVVAHVGGFVAGAGLGIGALSVRSILMSRLSNLLALLIFVVMITSTWAMALRAIKTIHSPLFAQ